MNSSNMSFENFYAYIEEKYITTIKEQKKEKLVDLAQNLILIIIWLTILTIIVKCVGMKDVLEVFFIIAAIIYFICFKRKTGFNRRRYTDYDAYPTIIVMFLMLIKLLTFPKCLMKPKIKEKLINKHTILKDMIKTICEDGKYFPKRGISDFFYKEAYFCEFEQYHSENLFEANFGEESKVSIAEVTTQELKIPKKWSWKVVKIPAFSGLFGVVQLENAFGSNIYIRKKNNIFECDKILFEELNLATDSKKIAKNFQIYVSNKNTVNKQLLSELVNKMIEFYDNTKIDFEITIDEKYLYIRFFGEKIFSEFNYTKNPFDKKFLYKKYSILTLIVSIYNRYSNWDMNYSIK